MYDTYGPETLFFSCCVLSGLGVFLLALFRLITRTRSSSESAQLHVNESQDKLSPEADQENDGISERRPILRTDCDYGTTPLNTSIQNS